jgi:sec-independent protein translocase protein TatA
MFRQLGPAEIILILVVVLLLFGAKRMPDAARSLGRSMRIFKSEVKEMRGDDEDEKRPADAASTTTAPAAEPAPRPLEGRVETPADRRVGDAQQRDVS